MEKHLQEFLIAVEAASLGASELRELKKAVNVKLGALIKRGNDPATRKRNRLEAKLADIQAELQKLKPATE